MGAIHFSLESRLVEAIQKKLQPTIFFETGTYKGDTIAQQLNFFKKIISVELADDLWKEASARFEHEQHVKIIHGNSPQVLAEIHDQLSQESVVYWLDAHWCLASGTAGEKSQCPLLEELKAIAHLNRDSIIIIDDARLFLAPPLVPHEVSEWPQFNAIVKALYSISEEHELMVVNDVILYYPVSIKNEIINYAQLHGVDWLERGQYAEEVMTLKKVCAERLELINRLNSECAILSKKLASNSKESDYHWFIDFPQHRTHYKKCELTGWVFHKLGIPIKKIRLKIKDKIFEGFTGYSRPDVSAYFDNAKESDKSGIRIPLELSFGLNQITIEVFSKNNYWEEAFVIQVNRKILLSNILYSIKIYIKHLLAQKSLVCFFKQLLKNDISLSISNYFNATQLSGLGQLVQYTPRSIIHEKYPKNHRRKSYFNKITIVTPSYNQGQFIEATIKSVIDQKYPNLEYIVIDGGSQDESSEIINKYKPILSYCVSEKDEGQSHAIQKGFAYCTGEENDIMAYLNSDDLYLPEALQFVAHYFQKHPELDVLYGHRILIDEDEREIGRWFTPRHHSYNFSILDYVPQETMFWRKRLYDKVGGIDPSFHFAMDWDLLLRFQEAGAVIKRAPYFLGCFRVHTNQKTSTYINSVGEIEVQKLRYRSHGQKISPEHITKIHNKNSMESAFTKFLFAKGIRI
jgi:glycosyltransferase involved in cell wall biosynthesis